MGERRVVTGSDDGSARVWLFTEKQVECCEATLTSGTDTVTSWEGHTAGITSVSFAPARSPEAGCILTSAKDNEAKIWNADGSLAQTLPAAPVSEAPKKYAAASRPAKGRQSAPEQDDEPFRRHSDYVNMAVWSNAPREDGTVVLTCSDDKTAVIWNPQTGQRLCTLHDINQGHAGPVVMASWNNTGEPSRVLTCSYDKTCMVWDGRSGALTASFPRHHQKAADGHTEAVWSAYFSADDKSILSASKDKTAKIWDVKGGFCRQTCKGHEEVVLHARWNPQDPNQIMTCSLDNTVKLWDLRKDTLAGPAIDLHHHKSCVWSAEFGNDPRTILTASHDMTALVYDQRLKLPKNTLAGHTGILWQASFSFDDQWVVTCSEDTTARAWNLQTGARRPPCHVLRLGAGGHTQAVTCAAFCE
mmetsp:Transcript_63727/g.181001  ORF Transcript_63727/g.181001 Transcript_63727/m.181001 type:complete len:416 (-) Transcript_63727:80-1327(-)